MGIIETVLYSILALVVFGILITGHEFGHFIFAKLFNVQVNEFSIGMGPRLFSWGNGETQYNLRLLPIGGYCAMEGEDGDKNIAEKVNDYNIVNNTRAFNRKPKWQRAIILIAGASMNFILGFIVMFCFVTSQELLSTTIVAPYTEDMASVSNASFNGGDFLMEGDKILRIGNVNVHCIADIQYALMSNHSESINILVIREDKKILLKNVTFMQNEINGITTTVMDFYVYGVDNTLHHMFNRQGESLDNHIKNCFISLGRALNQTLFSCIGLVRTIWVSLIDMVSGYYGLNVLSGPIGTTAVMVQQAKVDISNLIYIAMFISINLGIVNLLPFPALDGGRVVLLGIEAIRKKPLPSKVEIAINGAGLVILLALAALIALSDVVKILTGFF